MLDNMSKEIADLQNKLKINFKDSSLLRQALTHSSFVNENPGIISNERLEFLGDAVLGLVIGEKLYRDFPQYQEGELTRIRSSLVRKDTLSRIAKSVNLGGYLLLGKGEREGSGQNKPANLASALEAVLAAVYLDSGFKGAEKMILRLFKAEIEAGFARNVSVDYKSQLQAWLQSQYHKAPVYSVIEMKGPDHARRFTVEVKLDGKVLGKGSGNSKQQAETEAARKALVSLS